jgi:translation initiation factor IF-2
MSESKEQDGKLSLSKPGRLELNKTVETGKVRQSFSHGRSKSVTVEVKRKRTFERGAGGAMQEVKKGQAAAATAKLSVETPAAPAEPAAPAAPPGGNLTDRERETRVRALHSAAEDAERKRIDEQEARRKTEIEAQERAKEDERRAAEEERKKTEEAARKEAAAAVEVEVVVPPAEKPITRAPAPVKAAPMEDESAPRGGKADAKRTQTQHSRQQPRRRTSSKLTIAQALETEDGATERGRSIAALKRAREREKLRARQAAGGIETTKIVREVIIPETITVSDLANRMAERGADVVRALMKLDIMANMNQVIEADTAELIAAEFGHTPKRVADSDVEIGLNVQTDDDEGETQPRAPVVTIMGHVDHGKTSLLDALRETNVVSGEAGGITQHIGAYQVNLSNGAQITFLDTPGHEAFTEMRSRGAKVTDIVVLVIAADDSVQPQTAEAISHAKAAEVPLIVAINKMDHPNADASRIRNELLSHEIVVESLGGDVQDIEISALKKTNLDALEEAILLQAELMELTANADRPASGAVVEAKLERGRGAVATVLVQSGTLRIGDIFIAGAEWGRVRALIDDKGKNVREAGPSVPIEVLGMQGAPLAGDDFAVVSDEGRAREITEYRQRKAREGQLAAGARGTLEQMFDRIKEGEASTLSLVLKGDVQGSVEAITNALDNLATSEVKCTFLHTGVGGITESDIGLAGASNGVILGFNVRANPQARELARKENVDIRYYSIIYDLVDDMKKLLGGMLAPEIRESIIGYADVREVFNVSKVGRVAGSFVTEGMVRRGARVRLLRDDVVIFDGGLSTLRRFKDDVREVQNAYECGIALEGYNDIKVGDVVECYEVEEITREL